MRGCDPQNSPQARKAILLSPVTLHSTPLCLRDTFRPVSLLSGCLRLSLIRGRKLGDWRGRQHTTCLSLADLQFWNDCGFAGFPCRCLRSIIFYSTSSRPGTQIFHVSITFVGFFDFVCLFVRKRYRASVRQGRTSDPAVQRAMATSNRNSVYCFRCSKDVGQCSCTGRAYRWTQTNRSTETSNSVYCFLCSRQKSQCACFRFSGASQEYEKKSASNTVYCYTCSKETTRCTCFKRASQGPEKTSTKNTVYCFHCAKETSQCSCHKQSSPESPTGQTKTDDQTGSNSPSSTTPIPQAGVEIDQVRNRKRGFRPQAHVKNFKPGKEIRLLRVIPLRGNDYSAPIKCYFQNSRRLDPTLSSVKRPKYTALSYQWGPANYEEDVKDIYINDELVCVRRNLWNFLDTMRRLPNEGPFFIDALCIDQSNDAEKSLQIKLMPKIYEKASDVLVWLGQSDNYQGVSSIRSHFRGGITFQGLLTTPWLEGLKFMVENEYWSRLWIVQEIVKARNVSVYTHHLHWDFKDLVRMKDRFRDFSHSTSIDWTNWNRIVMAKATWANGDLAPLHDVLYRWSGQCCRDPRDKIYGLLGIASYSNFEIQYDASLPNLYNQVLKSQRNEIYKKGYEYSDQFSTLLLERLELTGDDRARGMKRSFLKRYNG